MGATWTEDTLLNNAPTLSQRLQRWANVGTMLSQHFVPAGGMRRSNGPFTTVIETSDQVMAPEVTCTFSSVIAFSNLNKGKKDTSFRLPTPI